MDKAALRELIRGRLAEVERRLTVACARAGRRRSEITLVAVTKTVAVEVAALLPELGLTDLGENRPQELWPKAAALPTSVRWHLIGHLQRNKIGPTLPTVDLIHSVDSVRLLQALDQEAAAQGRTVKVLLEVNTSGEASKQGFAAGDLPPLVPLLQGLKHAQVHGLMTMAALQEAEACRPSFAKLRQLGEHLMGTLYEPSEHRRAELSMGMSNDYEVAVEEGATLIRLGTVLLGDLPT